MLVQDVMIRDKILLAPVFITEDLTRVRSILKEKRFLQWVPIVDQYYILGGIIRRDCARTSRFDLDLKSLVEWPECLFRGDDNIQKLIEGLSNHREENILVIDHKGKLIGFVSRRQIWVQRFMEVKELIAFSYDNFFDALYDAILILDREGRIIYCNNSYTRVIGVPIDKILGRLIEEIEPSDKILRQVLETGIPSINTRVRVHSLNMDIFATVSPILKGGEIVGVISCFRNYYERTHVTTIFNGVGDQISESCSPNAFDEFIGRGRLLKNMLTLAEKASDTDLPVVITGESGVGKEVVAKAIHKESRRRRRPMQTVNCAAIPDTLLESELFGYEEGSFTGARRGGRVGKFQMADGGTLFLDEVGDMSPAMQAKLLRVLQDFEIQPLGSNKIIKVDVRIMCATNKQLNTLVNAGVFRSDLYYRLNVIPIHIPPLRSRKEDIPLLVQYFTEKNCAKQKKQSVTISNQAMDLLLFYDWPGNVRELENAIVYALVNIQSNIILPEHLPPQFSHIVQKENCGFDLPLGNGETLSEILESVEKHAIYRALSSTQNNKSQAMKILGMSRRTFYSKLKKYRLDE